jgi:cell wall-associated NlpC family hydrolase
MSELGHKLVEEARSWKGTRFQHQGMIKGVGVDCAHFIALVARDSGIDIEIPHDYRPREDGTVMLRLLNEHMEMVPTEDAQAGDVLALCDEALRDKDVPRHLVFVSDVTPKTMFIVHASERGVREHRTDAHWKARIHSAWRLK